MGATDTQATDGRFRQGTTDHDGDGKMGGSMKDGGMVEKKADADTKPAKAEAKAVTKRQFDEADRRADPNEPTVEQIAEATMSRSIRGW